MKMRIIYLVVAVMLLTEVSNAQTTFGIRGGINFQNLNGKDEDGDKLENHLKLGFHIGVNAEFPIADEFYLQPGLLFTTKGATDLSGIEDFKASISYIELPIHFLFKPQLGTGRLIIGLGPYLAYAVSGKVKLDGDEVDIDFTNKVDINDEGMFFMKPFDAGADIFFGYEMAGGLSLQLNAQLGLLNLFPETENEDNDNVLKNTGFGLSLGYRF
jgi:hypothetical protein